MARHGLLFVTARRSARRDLRPWPQKAAAGRPADGPCGGCSRGTRLQASSVMRRLVSMSFSRPGVATTMWTPVLRTASVWLRISTPPMHSSVRSSGEPPAGRLARAVGAVGAGGGSAQGEGAWPCGCDRRWHRRRRGGSSCAAQPPRAASASFRRPAQHVRTFPERGRELLNDVVRLLGQLARGADDHADGPLAPHQRHPGLLLQGRHDHGQSKHDGLAAAGEGDANHVAPRQQRRQALHLWVGVTEQHGRHVGHGGSRCTTAWHSIKSAGLASGAPPSRKASTPNSWAGPACRMKSTGGLPGWAWAS